MQRLDELYKEMVAWRRYLHQHPELSFQEKQTSQFVASLLEGWGLQVSRNAEGYGVIARLAGTRPGKVVALRADMDALPIRDEKTCSYRSQVDGVMHACGHDAHTAVLLTLAQVFSEHQPELAGTIVFLFQPAEEVSPGGALSMIDQGALDGVDVIYGVHLWTKFPVGDVYCAPGAIMAAVDDFTIEIGGKGGHGGLPHETVDSIVIGSHLVINLQSIISRDVDPTEPCVITVGSFRSGSGFNVIAERAELQGTIRTFDPALRERLRLRVQEVAESTCAMFGAQCRTDFKIGYPSVVNDEAEVARFRHVAAGQFGAEHMHATTLKIMAGEDFAYYLQRIPGCFMFVGAGNQEQMIDWPHHHPRFDIDERSMHNAARLLAAMAWHYLKQGE